MKETTTALALIKAPLYRSKEEALAAVKETQRYKEITGQIDEYLQQAQQLGDITNATQAKAIDSLLSEMKKYAKSIDDAGMEARRPYNNASSFIKNVFDDMTDDLKEKVKVVQDKLKEFLLEEEKRKQAEQKALDRERETLQVWVNKTTTAIRMATTIEELMQAHNDFIKPFKFDIFQKIEVPVVQQAYESVKELGRLRRDAIKAGANGDPISQDMQQVQEEIVTEKIAQTQQVIETKPGVQLEPTIKMNTSLRKTIGWKVYKTEEEVDRRFLSVDPAKVKKFIEDNRDKLKTELDKHPNCERMVYGILFSYEQGVTTR